MGKLYGLFICDDLQRKLLKAPPIFINNNYLYFVSSFFNLTIVILLLTPAYSGAQTLIDTSAVISAEVVTSKVNESDPLPTRLRAKKLWERLNGMRIHIDSPKLDAIESRISVGDMLGAAELVTSESGFINITVRQFAAKMSTREETIRAPLSDFVATIMGIARDGIDARSMLTGNFTYVADPAKVTVPSDPVADFLVADKHYPALDQPNFDISKLLLRQDNQKMLANNANGNGLLDPAVAVLHPDPAGVLTSRAWLAAHAIAGTNRRLIEYTFKEFLCMPMSAAADAQSVDTRIGRDVDRFPGGDNSVFQTTCKSCHTVMDGFRGAFAKVDFTGNNQPFYRMNGVQGKYNVNATVFPQGFTTVDDSWVNNAMRSANMDLFGWRGDVTGGVGILSFAKSISNTHRFSLCMAQRAMELVCRRTPQESDLNGWLKTISIIFEADNYNLKKLFQRVAVNGQCLGE